MEIIDLSYPIHTNMLTFHAPWHPKVEVSPMGTIDTVGRETKKITMGTHTGTHVDAPLHFIQKGMPVDKIPLSALIGPVTLIDVSSLGEGQSLTASMLEGRIHHERVVFRFGWGKFWGTPKFYHGYPYFSDEAADYLIARNVRFVGMDTPSPDDSRIAFGSADDSKIHKQFLVHQVFLGEYLAGLDQIQDTEGWSIAALPLAIAGADGSPARVCLFR